MKMIKAVVRPERCGEILDALNNQGFRAVTRYSILGRGKQKGLKAGDVYYDELPKEVIMMVVETKRVADATDIIIRTARTNKEGAYGDGKIFVTEVEKTITISSGEEVL